MSAGKIEVICGGNCSGKTALALGKALQAVAGGKNVIMIQFLKGKHNQAEYEILERLEPELKMFCFEKSASYFEALTEEEKQEEQINIRNGLNYAKKVLNVGECDLLVLDEILGLLDQDIVKDEELQCILDCRDETDVILTGRELPEAIGRIADKINRIETVDSEA